VFVWRQAHIAGWLAPVGERSLLVIRPYLWPPNSRSTNSSTQDTACPCDFIDMFGESFEKIYSHMSSPQFMYHFSIEFLELATSCSELGGGETRNLHNAPLGTIIPTTSRFRLERK
jgi:hypothetical protein